MDENDSKKSTLDIYKTYFEIAFLKETASYYKVESDVFISEHLVTEYMKKVIFLLH